jgi:hypothetical protein
VARDTPQRELENIIVTQFMIQNDTFDIHDLDLDPKLRLENSDSEDDRASH